ncbi:MAG: hypothetical protein ACYDCC_01105 [Actinomycetota bacterium]
MRYFIAILIGVVIAGFGIGSIRSLTRPSGYSDADEEPYRSDPNVRVLYWCENCQAEIVVVKRGSGQGFRHCGESMHMREEILRELN